MQIGIVAKKIGLSVDAIRFYERNGLLPRPPRTEGGFRRYGENDVETLAFVRRVQGLGFKLSEIRGLLRLRGNRLQPCAQVQRRLQEKLADVQRKLRDLHKLEHELKLDLLETLVVKVCSGIVGDEFRALQAGGRRFDPGHVHQPFNWSTRNLSIGGSASSNGAVNSEHE